MKVDFDSLVYGGYFRPMTKFHFITYINNEISKLAYNQIVLTSLVNIEFNSGLFDIMPKTNSRANIN
jgi:hypothetical protein